MVYYPSFLSRDIPILKASDPFQKFSKYSLTPAEVDKFNQQGFLVRESVFDEGEISALRDSAERAVKKAEQLSKQLPARTYIIDGKRFVDVKHITIQFEHSRNSETIRVIEPAHELDWLLDSLIDDPRLVAPMRTLVGVENLALWTDKLNLKRPYEGSGFGWHQDSPYWIHDCEHVDQLPNVMLTLDDADESNGCLRLIPNSHKRGCLPGTSDGSQLGGFFTSPDHFDESRQVLMEAPAGSLIFFDAHTIHGSLANESDQPRRAIILTYQPGGFPTLKSREIRPVE